ncbi:hypothetical protein BDN71DRAFT_298957 [Pleurotus eryngii]|uniref:Uncharacterized protein n=1 Tax=Pleurotus eryngii TaxID=5323 RepID=A0A9P5ZMX8_PLEER|nr:hypothetical protein BDN71DRAFT_298957 [Pleurotus eryngii]
MTDSVPQAVVYPCFTSFVTSPRSCSRNKLIHSTESTMRPAFIIFALSAFAVARPFESPSVTARSDDILKGLATKIGSTVSTKLKIGLQTVGSAAADHLKAGLKDAAHAVVGEACDQAQAALATRSIDVADFDANLEFVAQETYQQMVDDHALEDSPENYAILKDLVKAGASALLTQGCDKARTAHTSRDVDAEDGLFSNPLLGPFRRPSPRPSIPLVIQLAAAKKVIAEKAAATAKAAAAPLAPEDPAA